MGGLLGGGGGDGGIGAAMGKFGESILQQAAQDAFQSSEKSMQENFKKDKEREQLIKNG